MRIEQSTIVRAPAHAVWDRLGDPTQWPRDLGGRLRCRPLTAGSPPRSGARYWLHLEVGAAPVGSLIELLEYEPPTTMSWTTIRGFEQRGHWLLRDRGDGSTEVRLSIGYQAAGGLAALVTDEISALLVRRYVREALVAFARRLDQDEDGRATPDAAAALGAGARALADAVHASSVLARAHVLRPTMPDRQVRALAAIARWGTTVVGRYAAAAALHPEATAVIDEHGSLTFAQLQERSDRLATALSRRGVRAGERLALACRNRRATVEALLAAAKLGVETVLLEPEDAALLGEQIETEQPPTVICDAELSRPLAGALRGRRCFVACEDPSGKAGRRTTLEQLLAEEHAAEALSPYGEGRARTPGGTSCTWPGMRTLLAVLERIPLHARERVLLGAPLASAWGWAHVGLAALLASPLVLQRGLDPEATLATIERERVSHWVTVPNVLAGVLGLPSGVRARYDTGPLRTVTVGGGPLPVALATRFMDDYGEFLYRVHGTAQLPWIAIATPSDLRRAPDSVGRPLRDTTVQILDEHDVPVFADGTGRIAIGSPLVAKPSAHGALELVDGLIVTSELGHLDDHGRLYVDRPGE
jgi:non-ribosomal peptide synthetase component F